MFPFLSIFNEILSVIISKLTVSFFLLLFKFLIIFSPHFVVVQIIFLIILVRLGNAITVVVSFNKIWDRRVARNYYITKDTLVGVFVNIWIYVFFKILKCRKFQDIISMWYSQINFGSFIQFNIIYKLLFYYIIFSS